MPRRCIRLLITLALGFLVAPLAADAEPPANVPRIGFLSPSSPPNRGADVFRHALRQLGWVEGQNLAIEYRWAHGRYEQLPLLAAELVRLPVQVLVTISTPAVQAAKQATMTLPIVMLFVSDAVHEGLVASLARPGGNLTGLSSAYDELIGKRLELLKETVPGLSRLAILHNPLFPGTTLAVGETQAVAQKLGVTPHVVEVQDPSELAHAFTAMTSARAEALMVLADPLLLMYAGGIANFAMRYQLPTMFEERSPVEAGGLMMYGVNWVEVMQRAATYVDKILRGAKPADLPVEQPMKFELVINLKTAQTLGLTIPPTLLFQADEVIR
jgi:putative tryptophan/tyrosine transport system substrate-binding protein